MMTARNLWQDEEGETAPVEGDLNPPPRILVVDDDPLIRLLIARVLMARGYQVDLAEDGEAAWQILNADFSYDLLVTDNDMPKMKGVELLKQLHAARLTLPVILVPGAMPTEELRWHPWLEIDARLAKPFSADELVATVGGILHRTRIEAAVNVVAPQAT